MLGRGLCDGCGTGGLGVRQETDWDKSVSPRLKDCAGSVGPVGHSEEEFGYYSGRRGLKKGGEHCLKGWYN